MPPRTSQDFCTILNEDNILFVALFDGYGIKGDKVSEVCVSESENYFYENINTCNVIKIQENPFKFLKDLTNHLDSILTSNTLIDIIKSGW